MVYDLRTKLSINVLTLFCPIVKPRRECSNWMWEKGLLAPAVWPGKWQLSIKTHLRQVCLLVTMLLKQNTLPSSFALTYVPKSLKRRGACVYAAADGLEDKDGVACPFAENVGGKLATFAVLNMTANVSAASSLLCTCFQPKKMTFDSIFSIMCCVIMVFSDALLSHDPGASFGKPARSSAAT